MQIDWGLTANVVFSGLVIVFFVLAMLIALVTLMGKVLDRKKAAPPAPPSAPEAAPKPIVRAAAPVAAPSAGSGSGEVVAVIGAAVSAYMEETAPGAAYAITGISPGRTGREKQTRPVWGFAGMRQNTEPF